MKTIFAVLIFTCAGALADETIGLKASLTFWRCVDGESSTVCQAMAPFANPIEIVLVENQNLMQGEYKIFQSQDYWIFETTIHATKITIGDGTSYYNIVVSINRTGVPGESEYTYLGDASAKTMDGLNEITWSGPESRRENVRIIPKIKISSLH